MFLDLYQSQRHISQSILQLFSLCIYAHGITELGSQKHLQHLPPRQPRCSQFHLWILIFFTGAANKFEQSSAELCSKLQGES
jgi:hypothetical protein